MSFDYEEEKCVQGASCEPSLDGTDCGGPDNGVCVYFGYFGPMGPMFIRLYESWLCFHVPKNSESQGIPKSSRGHLEFHVNLLCYV